MSTQQPHPLDTRKEATTDISPVYTRRNLATFVHALSVLVNVPGVIFSLAALILGPSTKNYPNLKRLFPEWDTFPPTYYFVFMLVAFLTNVITSTLAITTPKFCHRDQSAVSKSLFQAIITKILAGFLIGCYAESVILSSTRHYPGLVHLLAILILNVVVPLGTWLNLDDHCAAVVFVPFRKQ